MEVADEVRHVLVAPEESEKGHHRGPVREAEAGAGLLPRDLVGIAPPEVTHVNHRVGEPGRHRIGRLYRGLTGGARMKPMKGQRARAYPEAAFCFE